MLLALIVFVSVLRVRAMGFKHRFYQFLGASLAALALSTSPSWAKELQDWSFDISSSELTFSLSDQVFPEFFLLADPPRLVLDIPDTEIGNVNPEQRYGGAVQYIRVAQHAAGNVRVVIELAPEIVLSPDQADIQFDDWGDGQRHWRFRPLITGSSDSVVAGAGSVPTRNPDTDISWSAANLSLSEKPVAAAPLPLDPYESEPAHGVVTVPPLTDAVIVPPLEDLPEVNASTAAVVTEVTDIPPMKVPELEDTEVNETLNTSVAPVAASRPSSLPDLGAGVDAPSDEPDGLEPFDSALSQSVEVSGAEASADVPSMDIEVAAAADVSETDVSVSVVPTETALAPVEVQNPPATVENGGENSVPKPIQQPAAERTIVQTELSAPLTFGQPLPENR